ncbi:MAG: hypothetical protein HLUCCA11_21755, partial [Phormidesmis priestleyi Ana]
MFIRASIAEVIEQTGSISLLTDGERREHPETQPQVADSEIHANPVEAFNASLRWRNAAFRRKTNTYAKSRQDLQRTLDIYWLVHNFVRAHFTTKVVPAVKLGILEVGLSWFQLLT